MRIAEVNDTLETGVDREWRHGRCYLMASALSNLLGWPIGTVTIALEEGSRVHGCPDHVVHAWAVAPDGRFLDAGGFVDEAWVRSTFLEKTFRTFGDVRFDEHRDADGFHAHLDACYGEAFGKKGYASDIAPILTQAEEVAAEHLVPLALETYPPPAP